MSLVPRVESGPARAPEFKTTLRERVSDFVFGYESTRGFKSRREEWEWRRDEERVSGLVRELKTELRKRFTEKEIFATTSSKAGSKTPIIHASFEKHNFDEGVMLTKAFLRGKGVDVEFTIFPLVLYGGAEPMKIDPTMSAHS